MLELKLSQVTVIQKITSTNSHPTMHVKMTAMDLVFNAANVSLLLAAQVFTDPLGKSVRELDY